MPVQAQQQHRAIRIMWVVLAANLAAAAVKLALNAGAHSTMLLGDAYYTALDATVDIMLLAMMRFARKPADSNHPYGHAKFESVAVAGVAILIFAALESLGRHVWEAWHGDHPPHAALWQIGVLGGLTLASLALAVWQLARARQLQSPGLGADGWYTLTGCGLSLLSIGALLGGRAGLSWPDAVGATVAFGLTLAAGLAVGRQALIALTDEARLEPHAVAAAARQVAGIHSARDIRSRGQENDVHVDLTVEVDPQLSVTEGHHLASLAEKAIRQRFHEVADVTVHVEPRA